MSDFDRAMSEAAFKHRQKVETWLREHLTTAGVADHEVVRRCHLIQKHGTLTLEIDGKEVATMPDVVLP